MKESIIDTYSTIYFVDIVVANEYATLEELQNLYTYAGGEELDREIMNQCASTAICTRKEDGADVVLVKYNHGTRLKNIDKKLDFINTVLHEAGHVVIRIYEHMGQDICPCSSEPFCYLMGYVGECIYKTLTKK